MELNISENKEFDLVYELFENYPEASRGATLRCTGWNYEDFLFDFVDDETNKKYTITKDMAVKGFRKFLELVLLKKTCLSANPIDWDSDTSDAVAQCAVFDDIIYG